jgi:uroporphyrinogen-III synthase
MLSKWLASMLCIMPPAKSLQGHTIALPETRELDLLARMVTELGGHAYRCPFVAIEDSPDTHAVEGWLRALVMGQFQDLVLFTGEGLTRLLGFAERAGMEPPVREALGRLRIVSRGPKPVRALRALGLRPTLMADEPTTEGIIATLEREPLDGRQVAVQLYGEEPNEKLIAYLVSRGASVHAVAPYVYVSGPEGPIVALLEQMAAGGLDAIAFTSSSQVHRLWEVAEAQGLTALLMTGLQRTRVAAVGPIVASTLAQKGARVDVVPERSFFLRPLLSELATLLGPSGDAALTSARTASPR